MPLFRVNGILDPATTDAGIFRVLPPGSVTPKHSARLQLARAAQQPTLTRVEDDDIVELEFEDGLRMWGRAADLQRDYGLTPSRDAGGDVIDVPTQLSIGGPSRGAGGWVLKGLKVVGIDIAGTITDFVADKVEGRLDPGPGLYQCTASGAARLQPLGTLDGHQPTLVFLHGTASSTDGSFGGLWEGGDKARIRDLLGAYKGQVLGFQHRTLTQSPIENALEVATVLAKVLGQGAELHLVSHSRGGMVGELLARGMRPGGIAFDQTELALFDEKGRERDRQALARLGDVLASSQLKVTRFVRVACPTRGTTLADERLDRYFSFLTNVIETIPALKVSAVYDGVVSLLAAVLKKRTDPRELPGIEAMMSTSKLVAMLNRPDLQVDAGLHVLGGDIEGAGVWGRLKVLATDLFYREDHDLVVPTPSMLGGATRAKGVRYWIDTGPTVNHFNYFRNDDTAARMVAALRTPDQADFHPLTAAPPEVTADDYQKRALAPQPVVIVVPGIMGSHLSVGGQRVWLDYVALAAGRLGRLDIDAGQVDADALVGSAYRDLVRFLSDTHTVVPFPYDWRRPLDEAAEALRQQIEQQLATTEPENQPVRIVAHSMGGLVVRAMIGTPKGADTWRRMCAHPGARVIMLGTPNGGSHSIAAMLIGRDLLVRHLALLDLAHSLTDVLSIVSRFDGVLQLLPDGQQPASGLDLLAPSAWQQIHDADVPADRGAAETVASTKSAGIAWPAPESARLAKARQVLGLLTPATIDDGRMFYVAGCADQTPCEIRVDPAAPAGQRVTVMATSQGDGRVTWATGIPPALKSKTYYAEADHGGLASATENFPALLDLLTTGATTKLSRTPPERRGVATDVFPMRAPVPEMFPDEAELTAAAMGSKRRVRVTVPKRKVRVRVVHDDLAHARSPVLVGHYRDDPIVSAEGYLDRQLCGRLNGLRRLGLYPGPLNTNAVVLNDLVTSPQSHPGAVVAGLGMAGELSPGTLTVTVARAVTAYGAEVAEAWRRRQSSGDPAPPAPKSIDVGLTAIVIGGGGAGVSTMDSLQAILRAVIRANARHEQNAVQPSASGLGARADDCAVPPVFVDHVDIVEMYEDRAVYALKKLLDLGRAAEMREAFVIDETLACGSGGRERLPVGDDVEWWQRMRIQVGDDDSLEFEPLTEHARVTAYLQPTQRQLVEVFLKQAVGTTATDPALCQTLFELLVPNDLKQYAPEQRKLVLVVDSRAAEYPWELLHDRFDRGVRPMSVETGMIRQLLTPPSSTRPGPVGNHALVVGDPSASDTSGRFAPLPGAGREAREVASILRGTGGYDVTDLIEGGADARTVVTELYARPYRIMHLAGHGVFQYPVDEQGMGVAPGGMPPPRLMTGVVLGNGLFLTPAEFAQLRYVPELVFINCCHLGTTAGEARLHDVAYHRLAANVATELIGLGAKAVIAAGWSVDDKAAATFARTFYESMLAGDAFGDAVRVAREETYRGNSDVNTWGAYQCYGDPGFSLKPWRGSRVAGTIVAEVEVQLKALDIVSRAARPDQDRAGLRRELDELVKTARPAWLASARTAAALGEAYGALRDFETATRYYRTVTAAEPARAAMVAIEQLANLEARWAASLVGRAPVSPQTARQAEDLFKDAEELLGNLIGIGETVERLSLLGSLHKRRAQWGGPSRDAAARRAAAARSLDAMIDAYGRAYQLALKTHRDNAWYPLLNRIGGQVVSGWMAAARAPRRRASRRPSPGEAPSLAEGLRQLEKFAATAWQEKTGFWELSLPADYRLLDALSTGPIRPEARRAIVRAFQDAARRVGSPRELASASEQVTFFATMARLVAGKKEGEAIATSLEELKQALDGASSGL